MDFAKFLRLLLRRKFLLIAVPIITVIVTYFLVRNMPDEYISKARIATGLEDPSQELINNQQVSQSEVEQKFNNLVQMMLLKKVLNQVSYKLMLHDLESTPFKKPSDDLKKMSDAEKQKAIKILQDKYEKKDEFSATDNEQIKLTKLIKSMSYDYDALNTNLTIYRENNSDFIAVEFNTENPDLSAFASNTLCSEFIVYYTDLVTDNQRRAVTYLGNLLHDKQSKMDSITAQLRNYKIQNHVLDLNEQAKSLYGQVADFETRIGVARKDEIAYTAALSDINDKFKPNERQYLESNLTRINQQITNTRDVLSATNEAYVKSNFNPSYQTKIDSLNKKLGDQINQSSDNYTLDPLSSKKDLVSQKMNLEVQLSLTKNSINSLQTELGQLNSKFNDLVPHEAVVQSYENSFDVASKEYLEALAKFNQASLLSNYNVQLKQIELAIPSTALPSKKLLLVAVSGIASFILCVAVLFALFYIDNSISIPKELANKTELPVTGFVNRIQSPADATQIWNDTANSKDVSLFKNLMSSIRFEVENEMTERQIIAITSMHIGDGKSFVAQNLAHAFASANKKVLLIKASDSANGPGNYIEDYLNGTLHNFNNSGNHSIVTLFTKNADRSLFEITTETTIKQKIDELKNQFEIIIIDAPGLHMLNKSKEWLQFADKIIPVYKAGRTINEFDKNQLAYFKNLNGKFGGWVLNKMRDEEIYHLLKA